MHITQIFHHAPALLVILTTVIFSLASAFARTKISLRGMEAASKESGLTYALISGVQKLRLSGSEKRALAK
ncbi:MAG: hypothetical protein LBU36_01385 [Clostridiales bacterium]|nr:hypothetical protein [Clostridiales bacterium]